MITDLRFILKDGKRILQFKSLEILGYDGDGHIGIAAHQSSDKWQDVPLIEEEEAEEVENEDFELFMSLADEDYIDEMRNGKYQPHINILCFQ